MIEASADKSIDRRACPELLSLPAIHQARTNSVPGISRASMLPITSHPGHYDAPVIYDEIVNQL